MKRMKLIAARAKNNWTLEDASEHIGCTPNTLSRWELGVMTPSAYNKARLCAVYGMTIEELGLEEGKDLSMIHLSGEIKFIQSFLNGDLTIRLLAVVYTPYVNHQKLQKALYQVIEEFTIMNTSHEAALT